MAGVWGQHPQWLLKTFTFQKPNAAVYCLMSVNRSISFQMKGIADMNRQEFTRRVLALEGRLYRISCGMLRSPQDRQDAVQEAVLKAWQKLDGLRNEKFFETWLTRILINECYNLLAARKAQLPLEEAPELPALPEGANHELRDALLGLEEKLRLPVILHYMEGYRVREIAGILGLPEGTVKTRLARAKRELKKYLEEDEA